MKKIFLMTALSLAVFAISNAQTNQAPQVRAKAMVSKVTNAAGLQGDQVGKVNTYYIEYFTKLDALGANPTPAKVKELNLAVDEQLKGTLSATQFKQWKTVSANNQ